jgi:hypothetical protein
LLQRRSLSDDTCPAQYGVDHALDVNHTTDTVLLEVRGNARGDPKRLINRGLDVTTVHYTIAVDVA